MKTILFNLLLILAVPAFGQKYHIEGFIKDSFTKEGIDSAKITLMTMDSIEVKPSMASLLDGGRFIAT